MQSLFEDSDPDGDSVTLPNDERRRSSLPNDSELPEADLDSFRDQWRAELKNVKRSQLPQRTSSKAQNRAIATSDNEKFLHARQHFLEACELERIGQMAEAVTRYARAVRLVPDIEHRVFIMQRNSQPQWSSRDASFDSPSRSRPRARASSSYCDYAEDENLCETLDSRIQRRGAFCIPDHPGILCPLMRLPLELIATIFRYCVGAELNVRCLEIMSMTCAGFYVLARDDELWRLICLRTFGDVLLAQMAADDSLSWRSIYIERPHVLLQGVYISKCSYIRYGESSFQDELYRPWHIVVYYRFLRFFADGTVIMLTSSDEPGAVVPLLSGKNPRVPDVKIGRYMQIGPNLVTAELLGQVKPACERALPSRRMKKSVAYVPHEVIEQKFSIDLRFGATKRRRNAHKHLHWINYETAVIYRDGTQSTSQIDVNEQCYPPMHYSRVRSYTIGDDEQLV